MRAMKGEKKRNWGESAFLRRSERDVSTSQRVEGEDEGKGGTINSLTSLNVHLMMHT